MLEFEKGSLFAGRYVVVRCIGAGGMGAVYLAQDPRYRDFPVALKVLYPGVIKSPELRERFKTEIVASYRISHKNIVRAYEYFDEENMQAYTMEYIEGADLHQRMKSGRVPCAEAVRILRQAAAGLEAIHTEGILHRDMKPENIMLTKRGLVKIADFGVARLRGENQSITQAGMMVGTPRYFAPEYVELGECDHRGDIFALGVIGYEMISGQAPFPVEEAVAAMMKRFINRKPPLHEVVPECPAALSAIIEKAICLQIGKRYQSAAQMRLDLEAIGKEEAPVYADVQALSAAPKGRAAETDPQDPAPAGPPAAQPQAQAAAAASASRQRLNLSVMIASLIVIGVATAFLGVYLNRPRSNFSLPPGRYEGVVNGLLGEGTYEGFALSVKADRVEVEIEGAGCNRAVLNRAGGFACGLRNYTLQVTTNDESGALGTLKVMPQGPTGRWSAVRSGK